MLSGVTRETRVSRSKLSSTGDIMLKLCRTKMTLPPHPQPHPPISLYLLINIPILSFLKEFIDNIYSVKHLVSKCTGYESKVSSSKNIPTFINFVHSRASCWQNLHTPLTVSETEALCSKNISIMPALCLMLQI